jgi:hypothetical protein
MNNQTNDLIFTIRKGASAIGRLYSFKLLEDSLAFLIFSSDV